MRRLCIGGGGGGMRVWDPGYCRVFLSHIHRLLSFQPASNTMSFSRCGVGAVTLAEIVRQKEYVHQSESILKRQLGLTTKTLSRKAQMATDDNILLIQYATAVVVSTTGPVC